MRSSDVINAVRDGRLLRVEDNPHYAIYDCEVKVYPATTFFVQTSERPIDLGDPMLPLMDTEDLHSFVSEHEVPQLADSPREVYLYNWVERAQGPMIFDVGIVVSEGTPSIQNDQGYVVKNYAPMKFASVLYHGPFPFQENSGWGNIDWERRAREKGHVYTERLYRELYHAYDWSTNWHITEIQIEIE